MNQRGGRDGDFFDAFCHGVLLIGVGWLWCPAEAGAAVGWSSLFVRVLEDLVERHAEDPGDPEGHLERGRVLALLDGDDRLAGHADSIGQVRLGHLAVGEPERADRVGDAGRLHHRWNDPW